MDLLVLKAAAHSSFCCLCLTTGQVDLRDLAEDVFIWPLP